MGYSARYHAASLAAVFLALAIGILIGAGIGDEVLSGTSERLEESLEGDLQAAREREDELAAELERERTYALRTYPALVADRLRGERIGVVAIGDLPEALARAIEVAVEPTGGQVARVAVVRRPPDLTGLTGGLEERFRNRPDDPAQLERLGRILGAQLVRGGTLLAGAREALLARFSGRVGPVDDGVVYLQPSTAELDPAEAEARERFESGVLDGIRAAGRPAVGVELLTTSPSSVPDHQAHEIPTVDDLELTSGKLATVFVLLGARGNFGVKEAADALLPEVVLPAPERPRGEPGAVGGVPGADRGS